MTSDRFDKNKALGMKICELDRKELCEFVSRLCDAVREDAPSGTFRGGIFPENISVDDSGGVAIGKAAGGAWKGQELEFLPPEVFWNGHAGSASDVYSIGLLLYYAVSGGRLPFNGSKESQQRRMNGESFRIPRAAGRRLGEIIEKATAFNIKDRYSCPAELKVLLDSCVRNLYLNGEPSAVAVFGKSDDDLSDTERMMVEIIEKNNGADCAEPTEEEKAEDMSDITENISVEEPEKEEKSTSAPASGSAEGNKPEAEVDKPIFRTSLPREQKTTEELEPIEIRRPAVQYIKSAEREKNIKKKARKKDRARTLLIIIAVCLLCILLALAYKTFGDMLFTIDSTGTQPTVQPTAAEEPPTEASMTIGEPAETEAPAATEEPLPTEAPAPTEEPEKVSAYAIYTEDVSWERAKQRCEELGGYLAVISSQEELDKVTALAEQQGIRMLWLGCRRVNGQLEWVNGEEVDFWPWGAGEPSEFDSGDKAAEDYLLLWYYNGAWCYNDSRNDPVSEYPGSYKGKIAFVCEKEDLPGQQDN